MSSQTRTGTIRALECPNGAEYDEEAFLYFLALEQARAHRSKHPLPLLLATLEPVPGQTIPFPRSGASSLFKGLRLSLRDTDVMGWYRQDHVAGAVLSTPTGAPAIKAAGTLEQRIGDGLRKQLPPSLAASLRVRVVQQGPRPFDNR